MPPRLLTLAIIVFWIGTTGWLFYHEVYPRLWPDAPPPFTVELIDEAQQNISVRWSLFQKGSLKGYCVTKVAYHQEDDTFELDGDFRLWEGGYNGEKVPDQVIKSNYRVTREGELR